MFRQYFVENKTAISDVFEDSVYNNLIGKINGKWSKILATSPVRLTDEAQFDHMVYAYLVENTGIFEVFNKVIAEFRSGGKLSSPSRRTMYWMEIAETLIYNDNQRFADHQVATTLRGDSRAVRRNAYYRMFGMDLNHGPFNYTKPHVSNREFVSTFENFLKEVWVGLANVSNRVGADQTDNEAIRDYAQKLRNMLRSRRLSGKDSGVDTYDNLLREEFHAVTVMSFLHLTISDNGLSVIKDLRAEGETASERLVKIGAIVDVPVHLKTSNFFDLAVPMSTLLRVLESDKSIRSGDGFSADDSPMFYNAAVNAQLPELMRKIINNWSVVTGRNMKEKAARV